MVLAQEPHDVSKRLRIAGEIVKTYLCSELVSDEKTIFDLNGAYHVIWHTHHHLLLLKLLSVHHGLLLAL